MSWLTCLDFFQNAGPLWVRFSYDFALKSLLLLLAVFLLYQSVRRLPSAFRHLLLSLSFFCLLLLPVGLIWGPEWQVPFLSARTFFATADQSSPTNWRWLALVFWIVGFSVVMLRVVTGLWLAYRLRRESFPLDDDGWSSDLQNASRRLGLRRRVAVLVNHRLGAAVCTGILRMNIIIPASALEWSGEQRLAILQHELGHIKRRDNLTNLLSLVVCALYWFNPLVWWAAARLRICREAACDDLVLKCGTRPSRYVSYLLEATSSPPRFVSVTLSQISVLKKRVLTILDPDVNRRTIRRAHVIVCSFLAVVALVAVSALQMWIIPSFTGGLAERLGSTQIPALRLASRLFLRPVPAEGRGQVQRDRTAPLLALSPGFVPGGSWPVLPDRYPERVITISGSPANSVFSRAAGPNRHSQLEPARAGSWESPNSNAPSFPYYGAVVSPAPPRPDDKSPAKPDAPDDKAGVDDLEVARLELGTLGGDLSLASDINEAGHVVGASTDGLGKSHPFLWTKAAGMSNIPCPSSDCQAIDINNSGQVLIVASDQLGVTSTSYVWSPDHTLVNIGTLGGHSTRAVEINDQGQVIGTSRTSLGIETAFFWSPQTKMLDLGGSKAVALNERGQVVGWASSYAYFWDPATDAFQRIGDLGVKAQPFDMNNRGEVVGYAHIGKSSQPKAFYWSPTEGLTEIQFPAGAPVSSCAFRINDAGEVLALARDSENRERTYSWRVGQEPLEQALPDILLPQLDWQLMSAPASPVALIGSNLPSSKLAEELAKVNFANPNEPTVLAQPVKMNGRGQIAGNLLRPALSETEAVVWEIRLPGVEKNLRAVLQQLPAKSAAFGLRIEVQSALTALNDNDYPAANAHLSTFLEILEGADSSLPQSLRALWAQTVEESLDRISHFTVLE